MDSLDFTRSRALNNIPKKKLLDFIASIDNSDDDPKLKITKQIAINRYFESNIPIDYWSLKMERDFFGDPKLLEKYNDYVSDLKKAYINGTSICFAGGHGRGKQLSLETDLPTPTGFIKLKDLKEGDQLFDEKGNICTVITLHSINLSPESYKIIFDDGSEVEACADHLWSTYTRKDRRHKRQPTIKSTKDILNTLYVGGKQKISNHSIKCANPLNYPNKKLPIEPYLFGLWLGDGATNSGLIETMDIELLENYPNHIVPSSIRSNSKSVAIRVDGLSSALNNNGLLNNKYIPNEYLYSSYDQRLSLLQGLLDSDGTCNNDGRIEFCTAIPHLADSVCQLVRSLGIKTKINKNKSYLNKKQCKDRYRITFSTKLPVFRLKRKLNNIRLVKSQLSRTEHRFITNIIPINSIPMRCITVDSPSHLFLITKSFIPTHNTLVVSSILKSACIKGYSCLYSTLSDIVNVSTQSSGEDRYLAKRELVLVDFLVIDEFDSRFMPSENAADLYARSLENVFRTRSQNKLPTLMCTNSPNIIESFNGSLKDSITSLMKGYMKVFPVFGEDFRIKGKK